MSRHLGAKRYGHINIHVTTFLALQYFILLLPLQNCLSFSWITASVVDRREQGIHFCSCLTLLTCRHAPCHSSNLLFFQFFSVLERRKLSFSYPEWWKSLFEIFLTLFNVSSRDRFFHNSTKNNKKVGFKKKEV